MRQILKRSLLSDIKNDEDGESLFKRNRVIVYFFFEDSYLSVYCKLDGKNYEICFFGCEFKCELV